MSFFFFGMHRFRSILAMESAAKLLSNSKMRFLLPVGAHSDSTKATVAITAYDLICSDIPLIELSYFIRKTTGKLVDFIYKDAL